MQTKTKNTLILVTMIVLLLSLLYIIYTKNSEINKTKAHLQKYEKEIQILDYIETQSKKWQEKEAVIIEKRSEITEIQKNLNEKQATLRALELEKLEIEKNIQNSRKKIFSNSTETDNSQVEKKENIDLWYDLDKLAYAIAMAETKDCTLWYGKEYNNCFGIKRWNTVLCENIWRNSMCIFETKQQSYEAFKKIWTTHYKSYPTYNLASIWTWNDSPIEWLNNVNFYYYN